MFYSSVCTENPCPKHQYCSGIHDSCEDECALEKNSGDPTTSREKDRRKRRDVEKKKKKKK